MSIVVVVIVVEKMSKGLLCIIFPT